MTSLLAAFFTLVTLALMASEDVEPIEPTSRSEPRVLEQQVDTRQVVGHVHGWSSEVSVAEGTFTLEVDAITFSFRGDTADPGRILIDISGHDEALVYRLWPDIAKWQLSEEGRALYSGEFEGIPGWREQTIRVCVDADQSLRRVWVDERLVKTWRSASGHPRLVVAGHEEEIAFLGRASGKGMVPYLELPLGPYFNEGASTPFAPDSAVDLGNGVALRYESNATAPHNLDLGKLAYRVAHMNTGPFQGLSMPYVRCDAMSSDPKRAIFRVPARYYDRLHLLAYADQDESEVARAAVRFMKVDRARFLTREFGLEPGKGIHVLESRDVAGTRYVHVAVDLNPGAFQEFLSEPENGYVEFELTRPVVMDNNSFEHPAGPPSSLHVLAMALEEASVAMTVGSDVPGHLFERAEDAVMRIELTSNRDVEVAGTVHVRMATPDGQTTDQHLAYQLPPGGTRTIDVDVRDAPVGKSDFTVRLEVAAAANEKRIMERRTSFAMLPRFERTSEVSPFGMWSFFEGHHGADIETTCGVLRKAGVRGTLANFVLGTSPDRWDENERRTALLRAHGIELNWGYLAGIAQTGLNGLGDLDAKFAWIKAHPQVKDYNLFWETRVGTRVVTTCPPEICGRPPIQWSVEERQQIDTFMTFGKTWAERARKDSPDIRIAFGNGFPLFTSAMLQAGFPHEYFDTLGLDFDMYTSAPEDQPSMWYAPLSGIYYLRELRKVYGCEDKPLCLTEAIYCPTSPIWLSEREQADYYVRAHLVALAMGVEQFGMCAEPLDPDGYYHYGHYGPVGLCHAAPEINPREAFCAYATMTGLLDGARFDGMLDLGSPHAYGLRFRGGDGSYVYALWTVNGSRNLKMQVDGAVDLAVYNRDGRNITDECVSRLAGAQVTRVTLGLDESPQYVVGPERLEVLGLGSTAPIRGPEGTRSLVRFDSLDDWEVSDEPLAGYEEINPATPVAWVSLDLAVEKGVLYVRLPGVRDTHPLETLCMAVRHVGEPLEISQRAEAIGVYARADRSWGRIVFVLEDKAGDRWVSAHSQTPIDVDGEIYVETALPKAPSASQPGYRNYRPWKRDDGDAIPEYPLRLIGLLFEMRTHVIHGPDLAPLSGDGFEVRSIVLR
jgi:hypothetical protein